MPRSRHSLILALYLALAAMATVQRGVLTDTHATFPVFRQSFVHLSEGRDLYATYPTEQGTEDRDRFKYSPTAALFFAPFSLLPLVVGLALWTMLNVVALYAVVRALFPDRAGPWALLIVFPALIAAIQSTSSNALVAALMVATFVALERRNTVGAAAAMVSGTLMKLYPAAAAPFLLAQPRRWRAIGMCAAVASAFLAAPLLVVSPAELAAQYRSWIAILAADGKDQTFARSIMVVVREVTGARISNLGFQGVATLVLVAPIFLRNAALATARYRRLLLASVLIFVVIFNHQAENASYVIAAVGLAIWFLESSSTPLRAVLLLLCLAGLEAVPYTLVWLWLQFDLLDGERLLAALRTRLSVRQAPVVRRLGAVAGITGAMVLSLWPLTWRVVALKPAVMAAVPPALAEAADANANANASTLLRGSQRRHRRGADAPGVPLAMPAAVLARAGASVADGRQASDVPPSADANGAAAPAIAGQVIIGQPADGRGAMETFPLGGTRAIDFPSCSVDTLGTTVPESWLATRVGQVRVEPGGVDVPNGRVASIVRRLHVPTRPDVVRRELDLRSGEAVNASRILESVRRLRESALFTDVVLEGRRCGDAASTNFSLRTSDAWSTRAVVRLGGRARAQGWLVDRNILGSGRTLSVGSEQSTGRQVVSAGVADPRVFGADVSASALVRLHADGREWAWSLRTNERSPDDAWRATLTSSQVRRHGVDDPQKSSITDITRRSNALTVTRRLASSDAGVWAVTSGIEQEQADLDVTRNRLGVRGNRAHRAFVAPLIGVARRSTAYRAIDWLVPGQRASELRVGAEGDFVAGFGHDAVTGGSVAHWDGWLGMTAMPSSGSVVTADVWMSGYRVQDSVENASVRASATLVGRAGRGLWIGRLAAERIWNPDPDVFALSTADPMLRTLSPTSRLAAQALSVQAERSAPLYARQGRWAVDGAIFATWSERAHTLDLAGNPVRVMHAAMVGVGLRQIRSDPRQSPLSIDIGRTVMSSKGLPNRWVVTFSASPSLNGGRARDGLRAPGR